MKKYSTQQLRESACAVDGFSCEKKPDSHNCQQTCWAYKDKTHAEMVEILEGQDELVEAMHSEKETEAEND